MLEPKLLMNKTGKRVEWMVDSIIYELEAGEKKIFDGYVANHALKETNTHLTDITEGIISVPKVETKEKTEKSADYGDIPWLKLRVMAMERGIFKPRMTRVEVEEALRNAK